MRQMAADGRIWFVGWFAQLLPRCRMQQCDLPQGRIISAGLWPNREQLVNGNVAQRTKNWAKNYSTFNLAMSLKFFTEQFWDSQRYHAEEKLLYLGKQAQDTNRIGWTKITSLADVSAFLFPQTSRLSQEQKPMFTCFFSPSATPIAFSLCADGSYPIFMFLAKRRQRGHFPACSQKEVNLLWMTPLFFSSSSECMRMVSPSPLPLPIISIPHRRYGSRCGSASYLGTANGPPGSHES